MQCAVCDSPAPSRCRRCHGAAYCSAACQRVDWDTWHKAVCTDKGTRPLLEAVLKAGEGNVAVRMVPGRGRALIALRPLAAGSLVLRDPASLLFFPYEDWVFVGNLFTAMPLAQYLQARMVFARLAKDTDTPFASYLTADVHAALQLLFSRTCPRLPAALAAPDTTTCGAPGCDADQVALLLDALEDHMEKEDRSSSAGGGSGSAAAAGSVTSVTTREALFGMLFNSPKERRVVEAVLLPQMCVAVSNSYGLCTVARDTGLACLSAVAALINHSCSDFNVKVGSVGPVQPFTWSPAGSSSSLSSSEPDPFVRVTTTVAYAVCDIPRGKEIQCLYHMPDVDRLDDAATLSQHILRLDRGYGMPCTCDSADTVRALLRRSERVPLADKRNTADVMAWIAKLHVAASFRDAVLRTEAKATLRTSCTSCKSCKVLTKELDGLK